MSLEYMSLLYKAAFYNKVSGAYLITARGEEEAADAAYLFLQRLYCRYKIGCGVCPECKKVLNNNHVDILNISSEANLKKEDVLPIADFISNTAYEGKYKCVLIRKADTLNEVCQNFLLKSIEEPPENVVFILTSSAPDKLLLTVRSRTVRVDIPPTQRKLIAQYLNGAELADIAAAYSMGSPHKAKALLADEAFFSARQDAIKAAELLMTYKRPSVFKIGELAAKHEPVLFLETLFCVFRDALVLLINKDAEYLYNPDKTALLKSIGSVVTPAGLYKISEKISNTIDAKRTSPGINSTLALRSLVFGITEVRNKCLK